MHTLGWRRFDRAELCVLELVFVLVGLIAVLFILRVLLRDPFWLLVAALGAGAVGFAFWDGGRGAGLLSVLAQSAEDAGRADRAINWQLVSAVLAVLLVMSLLWNLRPQPSRPDRVKPTKLAKGRRIVLDGTNILYWMDSEEARLDSLRLVVRHLTEREFLPLVFLDASSRHHLRDKSLTARKFAQLLDIKADQVFVCPAGTEADEFILDYATAEKLPVVSNDQFRDRARIVKTLKLVKGVIVSGTVRMPTL